MARIHARRRGKSGSHRPIIAEVPEWQGLSKKEIKDKVLQLSREGHSAASIGLILRDQHGVPSVRLATGQRVAQILAEGGITPKLPDEMQNLIKKALRINEHLQEKRKDLHNKRALTLTESKIRSLARYYKRTGRLPQDWAYSIKTARLLVE